jgi:phosphoadenosine phosphosulfate reductase
MKDQIAQYQEQLNNSSAQEVLAWAEAHFPKGKIALAQSFGLEDMVLMYMITQHAPSIAVFTLDTGRIFQETYDLWETASRKLKIEIEPLFPDREEVEAMLKEKGPNSFYASVENRKECCRIRKIHPLQKKLAILDGWITGLRREQAVTRTEVNKIEWVEVNGLVKLNPLCDWSEEDCWNFAKEHRIPTHSLHKKGFPSIGCMPCTRAVKEGEDIRAGRWWWENPESKECGLHKR